MAITAALRRSRDTVTEAIRWRLDRTVAKGTGAMVASLALIVVTSAVAGGAITLVLSSGGLANSIWLSAIRMLDSGSVQRGGPWPERAFSLVLVLVGILVVATVIALVVRALEESIDRVRNVGVHGVS